MRNPLTLLLTVTAVFFGLPPLRQAVLPAVAEAAPVNCRLVVLHLTPGVHPGSMPFDEKVAPDAPHRMNMVALPLYPGASPLQAAVESPYPGVAGSPYVQTGSLQYRTSTDSPSVRAWYEQAMTGCGWQHTGGWGGNSGTHWNGLTFGTDRRPNLEIDISLQPAGAHQTYLALAAQDVIYPAPPPQARLHGPFVQLRIAATEFTVATLKHPVSTPPRTYHVTVRDHASIGRLVSDINRIKSFFRVQSYCPGGPVQNLGPVWFTLIRPSGASVRGYENLPGPCDGLSVNHTHWLLDNGAVFILLIHLVNRYR